MIRVPETEIMSNKGQAIAYSNYDRSKSKTLLKTFYQSVLSPNVGSIVDLGCGPGDLTNEIATLHPNACVVGIDGSDEMLSLTTPNNNVIFKKLTIGKDAIGNYDRVVSSMTLHHFIDASVFWNAIKSTNCKDVFVFDLIRPNSEEEVQSYIVQNSPYKDIEFKNDFESSLRAAFSFDEIEHQLKDHNLNLTVTKLTHNQTNNFEMVIISGTL